MGKLWQIITNNTLANILLWGGMFLVLLRILIFDLTVLYAAGGICSEEDMLRQKIERQIQYNQIPIQLRDYVAPDAQVVLLRNGISNVALVEIFGEAHPISWHGVPPCLPHRQRIVAIFEPAKADASPNLPDYFDPALFIRKDQWYALPFAYRLIGTSTGDPAGFVLPQSHDLIALIPLPDHLSIAIEGESLLMHRAYDLRVHDVRLVPHLADDIDWWQQMDVLYVGRGE